MIRALLWVLAALTWAFVSPLYGAMSITICGSASRDVTCSSTPLFVDPPSPGPGSILGESAPANAICNSSGKCAYVGTQPALAPATPVGWSSPSSPPATATSSYTIVLGSSLQTGAGSSVTAACQDWVAKENATPSTTQFSPGAWPFTFNRVEGSNCIARRADYPMTSEVGGTAILACPAGYTNQSGLCNLTNASVVIKPTDGKCNIIRTGNTYSGDANDPDCSLSTSGGSAQSLNLNVSSGTVTASESGRTISVNTNGSTGATTVTDSVANSNNTTTTKTTAYGPPAGGTGAPVVTGSSDATTQGVGDLNNPSTPADDACGLPGTPPCKIDESGTPSGSGFQTAGKDALTAVTPGTQGVTAWDGKGPSPWSSVPVISGSSSCTNPTATFFGQVVTVDVCSIFGPFKTILAWFLYAITALYMWRRVTGTVEG